MSTTRKAIELLDLFSRAEPQVGLSELARRAGLNKATCFRLITDLCHTGLAEQVDGTKEYRLGPTLLRLAALREAHVPLRQSALPLLQDLAAQTGETAHISLLTGTELRPLAHAYANAHASRITLEDVTSFPFHATSSGLAVLAFQPPEFRAQVLARPLPALTPQTLTDPEQLRAVLARIAAQGMAESQGGFESDVHSFAVPIFDALGRCTGALAIAALSSRVTPNHRAFCSAALIAAARRITPLWGGIIPQTLDRIWSAPSPLQEPT